MVYLVVFTISILLVYIAEHEKKNRKRLCITCIAIMVPVFLAALRNESVGHDVLLYQKPIYIAAIRSASVFSYMNMPFVKQVEPLYALFTYIGSVIGTIQMVFFLNELLIVATTFVTIWHFRDQVPAYQSWSCFLFTYYMYGLNITRQSMAMSVVLLSWMYLDKKKYINAIIVVLFAVGFHSSAVVGFGIIILYVASKSALRWVHMLAVTVAIFLSVFLFREVFVWTVKTFSFLPDRYIMTRVLYLDRGVDFLFSKFFYVLVVMVVMAGVFLTNNNTKMRDGDFLLYMTILSLGGVTVGSQAQFAYRIFLYPELFTIFAMPMMFRLTTKNKLSIILTHFLFYSVIISYWWFNFVYKNNGEMYPYSLFGA